MGEGAVSMVVKDGAATATEIADGAVATNRFLVNGEARCLRLAGDEINRVLVGLIEVG